MRSILPPGRLAHGPRRPHTTSYWAESTSSTQHFTGILHFHTFFFQPTFWCLFCYNFAHFLFRYILIILFHFLAHPLMPFYASHSYLVFHIIFDTPWSAIHAYILHDVISFVLRPWEILILQDIFYVNISILFFLTKYYLDNAERMGKGCPLP